MFEAMLAPFAMSQGWIALLMLTIMEVVLGIDNIIFISIVAGKLPEKDQSRARNTGLLLALGLRILLLFGIAFIMAMQDPWIQFSIGETVTETLNHAATPSTTSGHEHAVADGKSYLLFGQFTGQSIILLFGGLFLLYKSVSEIHHKLEDHHEAVQGGEKKKVKISDVIVQITLLNIVFSFDSILTAVGLTQDMTRQQLDPTLIMILGILISMGIMMAFAGALGRFVNKHPSIQMLALSFLILIGFMLITEGAHIAHFEVFYTEVGAIPKGYLYFAMAFAVIVEFLNIRSRRQTVAVVRAGFDRLKERRDYINDGVF
jgi:predicted tellurium resistance membrane protein TerC